MWLWCIEVKRIIPIDLLVGCTKSLHKASQEFVIHVMMQRDYRMRSEQYTLFQFSYFCIYIVELRSFQFLKWLSFLVVRRTCPYTGLRTKTWRSSKLRREMWGKGYLECPCRLPDNMKKTYWSKTMMKLHSWLILKKTTTPKLLNICRMLSRRVDQVCRRVWKEMKTLR